MMLCLQINLAQFVRLSLASIRKGRYNLSPSQIMSLSDKFHIAQVILEERWQGYFEDVHHVVKDAILAIPSAIIGFHAHKGEDTECIEHSRI